MLRTAVLLLLMFAAPVHADAPPACPQAVTASIQRAFPQATIGACKAEHEHGKAIFEVKLTRPGGDKIEVDVAPGGEILQIEEKIAVDALPAAVKKAFAARYPRAKASGAEKQIAGKTVRYELAFQVGTARKEATFAADGAFVEEE
jgi:hypothetical protein